MQSWSRRRLVALASSAALFALVSTWVAAQSGPGTAKGQDGNGGVEHVRQEFDCYFTDGFYMTGGGGNDDSRGMGLLNWNANDGAYAPLCWLIIDD